MEEFSWPVMTASIRGLSTLDTEVCAVMASVSWATKGDGLVRGKTLKEYNYFRFSVVAMCDQLKKIPPANISIDHVKMKPKQITPAR